MDIRDREYMDALEARLREVLVDEYPTAKAGEYYLHADKAEIDYLDGGEPLTTLTIAYGRRDSMPERKWSRTATLTIVKDDLEFIAGQFFQAIDCKKAQ